MAQPRARDISDAEACPPCPECHSHKTEFTVKSDSGHYCRCENCGNVWHEEHVPATEG